MTVNGAKSDMAKFWRGLTPDRTNALKALAARDGDNWWKEVLASKDLLLGVRGGYLNAYVKGQSVFRIRFEDVTDGKQLRVETHYKYLVKPTRKQEYVRLLDGE